MSQKQWKNYSCWGMIVQKTSCINNTHHSCVVFNCLFHKDSNILTCSSMEVLPQSSEFYCNFPLLGLFFHVIFQKLFRRYLSKTFLLHSSSSQHREALRIRSSLCFLEIEVGSLLSSRNLGKRNIEEWVLQLSYQNVLMLECKIQSDLHLNFNSALMIVFNGSESHVKW